jgi:YfiR/HmsC-like
VAPLKTILAKRCWRAAAAATLLMVSATAVAEGEPTDTAVKAAFLPRFARYVTWPAAAMPRGADPFVLCVLGSDPFGGSLDDAARSQSVDGRRIVVRRVDSADRVNGCQIVFVEGSRARSAGQMLGAIGAKPVLTVTDAGNSQERGIIHFAVVGGRVRFFIDNAQAKRRGLTVSSRLLALAIGVNE